MSGFSVIKRFIAIPFEIPARLYNTVMAKLKSIPPETGIKEDSEKDNSVKVKVVIPRNIVSDVIRDSFVQKVQTETGVVLHFNYRILTLEKKPHSVTIAGSPEACQKAKVVYEKALLDAEMETIQSQLNIAQNKDCNVGDPYSTITTMERFDCLPAVFKDVVKVEVVRSESPDSFIVKIFHGKWNPLEQMLKDYARCLESEDMKKSLQVAVPKAGDLVAIHVQKDDGLALYRAEVSLIIPERGLIEFILVDTGDPMLVEDTIHMYKLSLELLNFPQQTMECGLADIEPPEDSDAREERWTDTEMYCFDELIFYRENAIFAKATSFIETTNCDGRPIVKPLVELWDFGADEDVDIGQQYIDQGLARSSSSETR